MDRRKFLGGLAGVAVAPALARHAAANATKLVVMVGTAPPDPACHFFYYAVEKGFYKKRGLEVDMKPIAAETTAVRALVAGEGDVAWVGAISTLQAIAAGSKLRVLSCYTPKLDYLLIGAKGITNLKEFAGHSVAVSQPGAVSQIVPQLMIEQAGGDVSKVKWVTVGGSSSRVQALIGKRVDGAPLNSSFAARALKYDFLHTVGDAVKDLPDFVYAWDIVAAETAAKKKDALQEFTYGTVEGVRWALKNPDEATKISRSLLPNVPPAELDAALKGFVSKGFWSKTGQVPMQAWNFTMKTMIKLGKLKTSFPYNDIVLSEFTDAAVKKFGTPH
jgi:NitT/TauT family transport system substrate-binding protein